MNPHPTFPPLGGSVTFAKTVTESDVGLFAGITGDFAPQHVNEEYMRSRPQQKRIAHGVLTLGLASTAAGNLCTTYGITAVSYGYDRVRFLHPVFLGDTVTVDYAVERVEAESGKAFAQFTATTQDGQTCMAGTHILYCYPAREDQ